MTGDPALTRRVVELIEDVLQVDVPEPGTDLVDAGLIDSLALLTLITEVEHEFAIQLPLGAFELSSFRSAERIAAVVAEQTTDGHVA